MSILSTFKIRFLFFVFFLSFTASLICMHVPPEAEESVESLQLIVLQNIHKFDYKNNLFKLKDSLFNNKAEWSEKRIEYLCRMIHMSIKKWKKNSVLAKFPIENSDFNTIHLLRKLGFPWARDHSNFFMYIKNGQCFEFLEEVGCKSLPKTSNDRMTLAEESVESLQSIVLQNIRKFDYKNNLFKLKDSLFNNEAEWSEKRIEYLCRMVHMSIKKWKENGWLGRFPIENSDFNTIRLLRKLDFPWDRDHINFFMYIKNWQCFEVLEEVGCKSLSKTSKDRMTLLDHLWFTEINFDSIVYLWNKDYRWSKANRSFYDKVYFASCKSLYNPSFVFGVLELLFRQKLWDKNKCAQNYLRSVLDGLEEWGSKEKTQKLLPHIPEYLVALKTPSLAVMFANYLKHKEQSDLVLKFDQHFDLNFIFKQL